MEKACARLQAEIFVVDNASSDGSLAYLQSKFPLVYFVANAKNVGFGAANNQVLSLCKSEYILFLNPDTIVPENCFDKCYAFMQAHTDVGALGVRMVDGSGHFLKESKRAFPSPFTSMFKLMGLSSLFPKNKLFAKYHLGHLSETENHEVDVLAGAFMWMRKSVLDTIGGFDEAFFMYGEDVDLSYRVQKAGFKNYYFPESTIIHFKGESTKKGSLNYVRMFYQAMSVFVQKHYGGSKAALFGACIQAAIWARAGLTALAQFIRWVGLPLIDVCMLLLFVFLLKHYWPIYVKQGLVFDVQSVRIIIPAYVALFLLVAAAGGVYDKTYTPGKAIYASMIAILVTLASYSLLPEHLRFSRGVILLGGILGMLSMMLVRSLLFKWHVLENVNEDKEFHQTLIVGTQQEFDEVIHLMNQAQRKERVLGRISVVEGDNKALGSVSNLKHLLVHLPCKEIIFCEGRMSFEQIIQYINVVPENARIKFHAAKSKSIIGSDDKDSSGEVLGLDENFAITQPYQKRSKRLLDIISACFVLISFPLQFLIVKKPIAFLGHALQVLIGNKTWIGYSTKNKLPLLKKAVFTSNGYPAREQQDLSTESLQTIDYWYAKDYDWLNDAKLILKNYRHLGD